MAMGGQTTGAAINAPIVSRHGSMSIFSKPDPAAFLPRAQDEPDTFGEVTPSLPTLLHDETPTSDGDPMLGQFAALSQIVDHASRYISTVNTLLTTANLPHPMTRMVAGLPAMPPSRAQPAVLNAETVFGCHALSHIGAPLLITYINQIFPNSRAVL